MSHVPLPDVSWKPREKIPSVILEFVVENEKSSPIMVMGQGAEHLGSAPVTGVGVRLSATTAPRPSSRPYNVMVVPDGNVSPVKLPSIETES